MPITRLRAVVALTLGACAAVAQATEPLVLRMRGVEPNDYRAPVVTALALSADGALVAAAGDDHVVRVWNAADGALVQSYSGHEDWVRAAKFGPDNRLATVGADHSFCLWDTSGASADPAMRRLAGGALQTVAFSPDGKLLATAGFGDTLRLFDLTASDTTPPDEWGCACEDTRCVAFSPDGRWVAAAGRNGVVRVWDRVASGGPRDLPSDGRRVRAIAFSPDGQTLASGGDGPAVRLWRLEEGVAFGSTPDELLVRPGKVHSLAFVDETTLATGDTRNEVTLWDTDTRAPRGVLRGHTGTVAALAVSADGQRLVSGSFDTTVRVWDAEALSAPENKVAARSGPARRTR